MREICKFCRHWDEMTLHQREIYSDVCLPTGANICGNPNVYMGEDADCSGITVADYPLATGPFFGCVQFEAKGEQYSFFIEKG